MLYVCGYILPPAYLSIGLLRSAADDDASLAGLPLMLVLAAGYARLWCVWPSDVVVVAARAFASLLLLLIILPGDVVVVVVAADIILANTYIYGVHAADPLFTFLQVALSLSIIAVLLCVGVASTLMSARAVDAPSAAPRRL